jgi:hypothetical protein
MGHPAEGPGLKPLEFIGLFQGTEAPCSLRRAAEGQEQIRRFWLRQNDEQKQAKANAGILRCAQNDKQEQEQTAAKADSLRE